MDVRKAEPLSGLFAFRRELCYSIGHERIYMARLHREGHKKESEKYEFQDSSGGT